jgi:15-cis-phytoene synthase
MTPAIDEVGAAACAAITRQHARTFYLASRFLTADKRRAAFAVYAFCRVADDLVDASPPGGVTQVAGALDRHRHHLCRALTGEAADPMFRELRWAVDRFAIPHAPFHDLMAALTADLAPVDYQQWSDLASYCEGVASTVGLMCAHIFGVPGDAITRDLALADAQTLGVAMQLTNILRDAGDDAVRGRCYFPAEDLDSFRIAREEILQRSIGVSDPRWRDLMVFEIRRARTLFAAAWPGLFLLDADSRACAILCATGYESILGEIERRKYDSLHGRARVSARRKVRLAWQAWRLGRAGGAATSPVRRRDADAVAAAETGVHEHA